MNAVNVIASGRQARLRYGLMALALAALATVWLLPGPADAATFPPQYHGEGQLEGTIVYDSPGLPPATAPCEPASFTFTATSRHAFVLNTVGTGFIGPIETISGTGESECANGAQGAGSFTLTISGRGPTGSELDCPPDPEVGPPLTGEFNRNLRQMSVDIEGRCMTNNYRKAPPVHLNAQLYLSPSNLGGGATERVTEEELTGAFTITATEPLVNADELPPESRPPNTPRLHSPPDGHTFAQGWPQTFSVFAIDPDGIEPFTATITVRDEASGDEVVTLETTPAPSGGTGYAVALPPLPEGSYTWSAHATDLRGARSGESDSRRFAVGRPAVAGGGEVDGTLTYESGIRPGSCEPTSFTIEDASATAAVADAAVAPYVGPLRISGSGSSPCEDKTWGAGTLSLSASGTVPATGATLECDALSGSFRRVSTSLIAELSGECSINGFDTGPTAWVFTTQVVPLEPGGGIFAPIRKATFDGGFTVSSIQR